MSSTESQASFGYRAPYNGIQRFGQSSDHDSGDESPMGLPQQHDSFDYLHFAKFLTFRNITIVPPSDLNLSELINPDESLHTSGDNVGSGSFMRVEFRHWQSRLVALKFGRTDWMSKGCTARHRSYNIFMRDLFYEIQVMSHEPLCKHPNIVSLLGIAIQGIPHAYDGSSSSLLLYPVLVVEPAIREFPDLYLFVERRSSSSLELDYNLLADIADGLFALHEFGVIHGDVKPHNILIFPGQHQQFIAKVSDFGFSGADVSAENHVPRGHTIDWMAPERGSSSTDHSEPTIDIYSYGLVCGYLATNGEPPSSLKSKAKTGELTTMIHARYEGTTTEISLDPLIHILETTLQEPTRLRRKSLNGIRMELLGGLDPFKGE